jgi:hypothetical protein
VAVRYTGRISVKLLQQLLAALVLQLVQAHADVLQLQVHLLPSITLQQPSILLSPYVAQFAINRTQQELVLHCHTLLLLLLLLW